MRLSILEAADVLPINPIPTTDHFKYTMWTIRLGYVSCFLHFQEKSVKIRNSMKAVLTKKKEDYNNRWSRYQPDK